MVKLSRGNVFFFHCGPDSTFLAPTRIFIIRAKETALCTLSVALKSKKAFRLANDVLANEIGLNPGGERGTGDA